MGGQSRVDRVVNQTMRVHTVVRWRRGAVGGGRSRLHGSSSGLPKNEADGGGGSDEDFCFYGHEDVDIYKKARPARGGVKKRELSSVMVEEVTAALVYLA